MASASSSSSASVGIDSTGGNLTINKPNYVAWAVIGLAVLLGGLWLIKRLKH